MAWWHYKNVESKLKFASRWFVKLFLSYTMHTGIFNKLYGVSKVTVNELFYLVWINKMGSRRRISTFFRSRVSFTACAQGTFLWLYRVNVNKTVLHIAIIRIHYVINQRVYRHHRPLPHRTIRTSESIRTNSTCWPATFSCSWFLVSSLIITPVAPFTNMV